MAPKGRGRKKAEVVEDKIEVQDTVVDEEIKAKKVGKVTKASKKGVSGEEKTSDVPNGVNGSGEPQEKIETEEEQIETASGSDVPANDKVASKRKQKPAKTKGKEESAKDEDKKENSEVEEEESKPKDLPAKRGRKAAKVQNGVGSTKEEECETKTDIEPKDLPRTRKKVKADLEPSTSSVKEQNKSEPKETKAERTKKEKVQSTESSEKKAPTKGSGRKRKNAAEKTESEADKEVEDEKPTEAGARQLRGVALKRNRSLDEMARQQMEDNAEVAKNLEAEEPKAKNAKGPAKSKGKRGAKSDDVEDTQPTKKPKENTSKSKGAAKKEKDKIPDVTALDFDNESKTTGGNPWNLKIATWNVNGIRAWLEKNGMSYLHHEKPDIMCIQETKCSDDKLPPEVNVEGYHCYWLAGDKDGYSGVGLLSKEKPKSVQYGIDMDKHDNEGRVITAEYEEFYLVTTYIPNAGRGLVRLDYRQEWDKDFRSYIKKLDEKKPVILCGDLNVAHGEIDIANPKGNKKSAGFTKEEREGFSTLLSEGFVDTFRHLYPDQKGAYTFWTYMMNARAKNVGWRLDYFVISERFVDHLCDSVIRKDVHGSDHCPIALFIHV